MKHNIYTPLSSNTEYIDAFFIDHGNHVKEDTTRYSKIYCVSLNINYTKNVSYKSYRS